MAEKKVRAAVLTGVRQMEIREFPYPKIGENDALLKVDMVGVCGSDPHHYSGTSGAAIPLILGHEIIGHIEEIGEKKAATSGCKKGDRVVVETRFGCGECEWCVKGEYTKCTKSLGYGFKVPITVEPSLWGAYSEYLYLPERAILHKINEDVPDEAGVLTCAVLGDSVRWMLHRGGGDTVVILGPGQQGLGGVVVARECGAGTIIVTGTSRGKDRLELAKRLGADYCINVDEVNPVEFVREVTGGKMADVVFDVTGNPEAAKDCVDLAGVYGTIVLPGMYGVGVKIPWELDQVTYKELTIVGAHTHNMASVDAAIKIIESGKYPLEEMVTHKFTLDEAELAIKTAAREIPGEWPIKVVIEPNRKK